MVVLCKNVIIAGGMNTSFDRKGSEHTKHLEYILRTEGLKDCLCHACSNVQYSFTSPVNHSGHVIDHFIVSSNLFNSISCYFSLHDGDNVSQHSPIVLKLGIDAVYLAETERTFAPHAKWDGASHEDLCEYSRSLDVHLQNVLVPWD